SGAGYSTSIAPGSRASVARHSTPLLNPSSRSPVASDLPYIESMHSWERAVASRCSDAVAGRYWANTIVCGYVPPSSTTSRPASSAHSPFTATWPAHDFTEPCPKQDSPDGQSASVAHGVSLVEHVRGTLGVAGCRALFTSTRVIVVRTCVR